MRASTAAKMAAVTGVGDLGGELEGLGEHLCLLARQFSGTLATGSSDFELR